MPHDQAFLLAEKKIEEALQSGAEELDLRDMKLTKLPESIGQLTQLSKLDLGHELGKDGEYKNQLTTLPDSLGQLTQLTDLNISDNKLKRLPESLMHLTQLKVLNLYNNQLKVLPETIDELANLNVLDVGSNNGSQANNQLVNLPQSLGNLTQLQILDVNNNRLRTLPNSIAKLTQLKSLDLRFNQFELLPESISKLINLEHINLGGNNLKIVPEILKELSNLQSLWLWQNDLKTAPTWVSKIKSLKFLSLHTNHLTGIPDTFAELEQLESLGLNNNPIVDFPYCIRGMTNMKNLDLGYCQLKSIPNWLSELSNLEELHFSKNSISVLPLSLVKLEKLTIIELQKNPLEPELAEAFEQGIDAVKLYLRAGAVVPSYEAKLILVGEGEVGKTCLMDALLDKPWQDHLSTHGIEIQSFKFTYEKNKEIKVGYSYEEEDIDDNSKIVRIDLTLNGWDFGGQRVYRPTHQLFFSAPAIYLVVWKPREGPQQGFVKEWIQLVKRREPSAKILVVATHGGPQQRQPDIDRQELWDLFGKDTVVDFFTVDSKPDAHGHRKGITELQEAIARVAATLPEVGRSVPKSFADVRAALQERNAPYLPLDEVLAICRAHHMDDEIARLFITISHRLGHLTHYENDPALRDIVILRPDWLATAMSYVLDDEATRKAHGLVGFSRLGHLWDDTTRPADTRYPATLHRIFLRLMERFDLSYRVAGLSKDDDSNPVSLVAQLVPDTTPKEEDFTKAWTPKLASGDLQQTQICRIVDKQTGQSANAEGLFYQLIVRLHKYSLGRVNYNDSVHWQRGLILDANYNGRALLRHIGNDVHITVRAAFPERFLGMLTEEVKYLVESFWEGLRCEITVPCLNPTPCRGLFEVSKLIESKRDGQPKYPCPICNSWQNIDVLLRNAPAATEAISLDSLMKEFAQVKDKLDIVNDNTKRILSQVDKQYADLIQLFTDEAKEGPRLFSLFPLDGNKFNPQTWMREKFRLVLWCEHSRLPLPVLNNGDMKNGVYDLEFDREWFKRAVPFLKFMTGTLSLVLPVASSTLKVANDALTKSLQDQLGLGKNVIDAIAGEGTKLGDVMGTADVETTLERGVGSRAENATLRELHALIKAKDPLNSFGGLVRVLNKRNEFLWVHEKFAGEY